MGIGVVALQTSQKKEPQNPPAPPFDPTSANNGLSVDPVSGKIVLGNDVGAVGSPAQLLNDREILTEDALFNLFAVVLNSFFTGIQTRLEGMGIQINGSAGTSPYFLMSTTGVSNQLFQMNNVGGANNFSLNNQGAAGTNTVVIAQTDGLASMLLRTGNNGTAQLRIRSAPDSLEIKVDGLGAITFQINNTIPVWQIYTATGNTQIGPTLVATNTAALQVTGTLTNRRFISGKGAGAYNVDRDLDSSKNFINSAAATFNLPNMAGANDRPGFIFRLCIKNIGGSTIQTFAGQSILFGSLSTSVGGTLSSTDVGAYAVLVWDSSNWTTETFNGVWALT
jgi:hypothetical protein